MSDQYEVRVAGGRLRRVAATSEDRRRVALTVPVTLDMTDQLPLIVELRRPGEVYFDLFWVWCTKRGDMRADNHAEPRRRLQALPGIR